MEFQKYSNIYQTICNECVYVIQNRWVIQQLYS